MQAMTKVTAVVETKDDERRLGRLLETLRAADQIVVVDQGSTDKTLAIARSYGAVVLTNAKRALDSCANDWVLVLLPDEGIHESFEASLLEWKLQEPDAACYAVEFLADVADTKEPQPKEVRLAHRTRARWRGLKPDRDQPHAVLPGVISRFLE